jgi:hypothetical protein
VPLASAQPADLTPPEAELPSVSAAQTVHIQAHTQTWRSRGRVSFPVVPSLRTKLSAAGFAVVADETEPHELVLRVDYREARDREYRFGLYGTAITCELRLEDRQGGLLLGLTIHEYPPDDPGVTAPYTEVVHKLDTNPYYYFFGEIVKEKLVNGLDTTGSLLAAFVRLTEDQEPQYGSMTGPPPNPGETLPSPETLWVREVRANTAHELARLQEPRAIPVLNKLLTHPDWQVRSLALDTLVAMRAGDMRAEVERMALQDEDKRVRAAAKAALARLSSL